MDEAKLPEEEVDGLSDRVLRERSLFVLIFVLAHIWWFQAWQLLIFPLVLAILGLPYGRATILSTLGAMTTVMPARLMNSNEFDPVRGASVVAGFILLWEASKASGKKVYALSAGLLAWLIGAFSGNLGSAGRMFTFFTQTLGINPTTAESLVFVVRKSVHIGCYGVLAALIFQLMPKDKPARWLGAALAAMTFAGFDERRQTQVPGRTGTAWDLLWDMLGVVLALGLVIGIPKWHEKRLSGSGLAS